MHIIYRENLIKGIGISSNTNVEDFFIQIYKRYFLVLISKVEKKNLLQIYCFLNCLMIQQQEQNMDYLT